MRGEAYDREAAHERVSAVRWRTATRRRYEILGGGIRSNVTDLALADTLAPRKQSRQGPRKDNDVRGGL